MILGNREMEVQRKYKPEKMVPASTRVPLEHYVSRFRILKDWDVRWGRANLRGQCFKCPSRKELVVFPWGNSSPEPMDYRLHETLHGAFAALLSMDKRKRRAIMDAEEELIQDICEFIVYPVWKESKRKLKRKVSK